MTLCSVLIVSLLGILSCESFFVTNPLKRSALLKMTGTDIVDPKTAILAGGDLSRTDLNELILKVWKKNASNPETEGFLFQA